VVIGTFPRALTLDGQRLRESGRFNPRRMTCSCSRSPSSLLQRLSLARTLLDNRGAEEETIH